MKDFEGVIIEESLADKTVLDQVEITSTKVENVTDQHRTPWVSSWTLHQVRIPQFDAASVAEKVSAALDQDHGSSWYADFQNEGHHFIVFPNRVFRVDKDDEHQYGEAKRYGISLGIPEYQVDFHPETREWER